MELPMELRWPSPEELASYVDALERGWSPNTMDARAGDRELEVIRTDAGRFLAAQDDRDGSGPPVTLPDGSVAERIPGFSKWMWDGEFCGRIGFRCLPGTEALPPHVLGHVGYAVVPWRQRRGYATRALGLLLADIATEGLRWIEITTDPDNVASQRVIEANGGQLLERFDYPSGYGRGTGLRYRIELHQGSDP
ncbi:MAG TPA: GNAT family N-acetyltransferase [Ilumatobacteraceae bacterium]|nr:GNAT family N-acetyltransferase [Ilumatobacteraceae bacterium]